MTWFPRDTVWDTTPLCHAVIGTVVNTLAWGLFLRDHPWNIVRDCLFSFVSVFNSNPRYRAPLSATWRRARWSVLGPPDRLSRKPMQDRYFICFLVLTNSLLYTLLHIHSATNKFWQHIKRFQNRPLLRWYIASSEISSHRRHHNRSFLEYPSKPWCKPLWLCQLSQNDVLSWEFSGAETKRSLGEPRQDCRAAGESLAPLNRSGSGSRRRRWWTLMTV